MSLKESYHSCVLIGYPLFNCYTKMSRVYLKWIPVGEMNKTKDKFGVMGRLWVFSLIFDKMNR